MADTFDPAGWLAAFEAAGGSYAVAPDGRLWLFTAEVGASLAFHTAQIAGHPERSAALTAIVKERCLIA
jgi:hypothetical protein